MTTKTNGRPSPVAPYYVSQHTAREVLGVASGRKFIRWARKEGLTIRRVGHDLLVLFSDCVAAIERHAETPADLQVDAADDAPSIDDVRASLGVTRV